MAVPKAVAELVEGRDFRISDAKRESTVAIDLCRVRQRHSLRQFAHGGPEGRVLGRQIQVHGRPDLE